MRITLVIFLLSFAVLLSTGAPAADFGAEYMQDFLYNIDGGLERGGGAPGVANFNAAFENGDDLFYTDVLGTFGGSISDQVGDLQGVSNISAYNTLKLYEAWYQHSFGASGVSVRLGLQDYAALFNMLDPAQLFLNSSFGTDPTVAQVAPSIFPVTTLGAVARWESPRGLYAMGGVFDGVSGRPGHPAGTQIALASGDGAFSAVELGITGTGERTYKLAAGGWYRSTDFVDPAGRRRDGNSGIYAIGSMQIAGDAGAPGASLFLQVGQARHERNAVKGYIGGGVTITGLVDGRPHDRLGIGVASAQVSDAFQRGMAATATGETAIELTYMAMLSDRFYVQPDVQYIIHPGASDRIDNAVVVGLRVAYSWP
ncbi:MAG TPA: carbohydrate porin [Gammaproteobacteria bacterium]|nr:carbohydrate porin [Gammaproteobacteria bacterium]